MERLATGAWLDRRLMRAISAFTIACMVGAVALLLAGRMGTLDAWGRPIGTDFSSFWSAGRLALEGRPAAAYDWAAHLALQRSAHGSEAVPFYPWHYPPPFLLVAAALAALPYLVALALFQVATLVPALLVLRRILPDRDTLLVAMGCPVVLICVTHGHNGFLTAFLFGAGLLFLREGPKQAPILAGLCFGLLCYKPQFGLLIPVALALGGYWRTIAAATATVVALALATTAIFGPEVWTAFLGSLTGSRTVVLEGGGAGWFKFQSAFAAARLWGVPVGLAYALQGLLTLAVVLATGWLWHVRTAYALRAAALLTGSLLATPYVVDYDMALLGPAIAFLVAHGLREGFAPWEKTALALAWAAPIAARPLANGPGIPAGLLAMAWLMALVVRRGLAEAPSLPAQTGRQPLSRSAASAPR